MVENKTEESTEQNAAASAEKKSAASQGGNSIALTEGQGGILGIKAGMTQVYGEDGNLLAVTVIDVRPNVITQVKTKEKDGYSAVQVGFIDKKSKNVNKAEAGHLKKAGAKGFVHYQEFRLPEGAKTEGYILGAQLSPEFVKAGDKVDLTSVSKGKGFQGVIKRHNYAGGAASHGASVVHRSGGSLSHDRGTGKIPKGKGMAGQMGNEKVTVQNLKVVRVDAEKGLLLVHGSVPGPRSGIVTVRRAIKGLGA